MFWPFVCDIYIKLKNNNPYKVREIDIGQITEVTSHSLPLFLNLYGTASTFLAPTRELKWLLSNYQYFEIKHCDARNKGVGLELESAVSLGKLIRPIEPTGTRQCCQLILRLIIDNVKGRKVKKSQNARSGFHKRLHSISIVLVKIILQWPEQKGMCSHCQNNKEYTTEQCEQL